MSGALRFDLARGRISLSGASAQVVLPAGALVQACADLSSDSLGHLGSAIGTEVGRRVNERLGRTLESASPEEMLDHLGGELALMGLGSLGLEFWGAAMVFTVTNSPLAGAGAVRENAGDSLIAGVLRGALQRAVSRQAAVISLGRVDETVRFLVCSDASAEQVHSWLTQGTSYADALARLNEGAA